MSKLRQECEAASLVEKLKKKRNRSMTCNEVIKRTKNDSDDNMKILCNLMAKTWCYRNDMNWTSLSQSVPRFNIYYWASTY